MKTSTVPVICTCALTALSAAGLSHWWSLRQFTAVINADIPRHAILPAPPAGAPLKAPDPLAANPTPQAPNPPSAQKQFYEALLAKMEGLQTQNRDLLDQLAETNRDIMKLEFRVDTHSESFRPMPVSEDRPYTSTEDEPGVLPPRAEPVVFPDHE